MQQKLINNTKGSIAALQTILERYPILVTTNENMTKTSLDFMLDILRLIGVTEQDVLEWLSNMLAGSKDTNDGILSVLEQAIKLTILTSFKDTYTCSVNPILPDDIMCSFYEESSTIVRGGGVTINVDAIDPFGALHYCPLDNNESVFYFDVTENAPNEPYSAHTIYRSADFNAYLWYILNRSNFDVNSERLKCIWDNRDNYYSQFKKNPNIKNNFFNKHLANSPSGTVEGAKNLFIKGLGTKKELFECQYIDNYSSAKVNSGAIRIYLNADRYYKTTPLFTNKTIFEFNADYLSSIRLFDSKTIAAQLVNSILCVTNSSNLNLSIEKRVMANKVREIVRKVIEIDDTETNTNDCYFTFTNQDYENMLSAAELQQNGQYLSGNENNDLITVDTAFTVEQLQRIESAENLKECETAINNALSNIADAISDTEETPDKDKYSFKLNIINRFIEELCVELTLQALSPKIMILYAINEKIMSPNEDEPTPDIFTFFKKFNNLITAVIKSIKDYILNQLFDFLMSQIKPMLVLFIEKLLLETIVYYRLVLTDLYEACKLNKTTVDIGNVNGADIISELKSPEEGCRTK